MRSFTCPACGNLLFFENSSCLACGTAVGYSRPDRALVALDGRRRCANAAIAGCNWIAGDAGPLCDCCALTRTRPADGDAEEAFARAEAAKRRLVHQLDDLGLPTDGVVFDLLSSEAEHVVTGHASGVITIDLAEGVDSHREAVRARLAEPYRTLLGHFRHEVGHWYWEVLVERAGRHDGFRAVFGDERADYQEALREHYAGDPDPDWNRSYVSTYAAAHPWEDWAETFAHLLHVRDTVQTAGAYGVLVAGRAIAPHPDAPVDAEPAEDGAGFDELVDTWVPLSRAVNQLNRSMGKDDLYPFVLAPDVLAKLRFVDSLVAGAGRAEPGTVR
ncbi:zinc-binding metallopeptidase family protein [Umezawaea sp.]|uniref:zinc-binding metallopeptidase family protein n=1 Tax=Umezawaea sp. TaxID=1955258 RepID=UPI002ED0F0B9